jgi:hypothetical protein
MDIKEAQQRYGNAIAQILDKYAAIVKSPAKATPEDGIAVLKKWTAPKKTRKEEE